MSQEHETHDRECGDDVAAYALGALSEQEAQAFRGHLDQCAICRDELASFEAVLDVLPLSAEPQRAPASLRRRVMREVAGEQRGRVSRPRWTPAVTGWRRPALAAAAVLAVLAGIARGGGTSQPSTRVYRAQVTGGGTGELKVKGDATNLVVRHMAAPPAGKIYEVWLKRPNGAPAPTTALFGVTSEGDGDVVVPGNLSGVREVMVTPEPLGGSRIPTHAPVLTVHLS